MTIIEASRPEETQAECFANMAAEFIQQGKNPGVWHAAIVAFAVGEDGAPTGEIYVTTSFGGPELEGGRERLLNCAKLLASVAVHGETTIQGTMQ